MKEFFLKHKRYLVMPVDASLAALAFYIANVLRFDHFNPEEWTVFPGWPEYARVTAIFVGAKLLIFILMGVYRSLWAYASLHDIVQILKATVLSSIAGVTVLALYNRMEDLSRSALILDGLLLFFFIGFRSFSWRIVRDLVLLRTPRNGQRTLLIGAGLAAGRLVRELRDSNKEDGYHPVAILDDDRAKRGAQIMGVPVAGALDDLEHVLRELAIESLLITEKLSGAQLRRIYRLCEAHGVHCKTLPPLHELLARPNIGTSLREISLEDLLGRDVVNLEFESIATELRGKTILITGAGGSIGSEVCRQLIRFQPAALLLVETAETPLYEIDYHLRNMDAETRPQITSIIADIRDGERLHSVFRENDVQVVFHCAAYKHVPMMELNPGEAVMNNVIGTVRLADAARDAGVDRFVMISTDKAVNPVNIMGATKRLAELYIQNLARTTDTCYITVRFGNVLGSNGSVIPLFTRQITEGGPVTVTHPDIIRYFMTIPEAAGLVIQAGVMGQGGEIFILDMGEPVKIRDLAEDMIRFAGLVPHKDIEIRYIGLRPGEKLFEELLLDGEGIQPTRHEKIHIAMSRMVNLSTLNRQLQELEAAARRNHRTAVDDLLSSMLPEYRPVYTLGSRSLPPLPDSSGEDDVDSDASQALTGEGESGPESGEAEPRS